MLLPLSRTQASQCALYPTSCKSCTALDHFQSAKSCIKLASKVPPHSQDEDSEDDFAPRRSTRQRSHLIVRMNGRAAPVDPLRRTRAAGPVQERSTQGVAHLCVGTGMHSLPLLIRYHHLIRSCSWCGGALLLSAGFCYRIASGT